MKHTPNSSHEILLHSYPRTYGLTSSPQQTTYNHPKFHLSNDQQRIHNNIFSNNLRSSIFIEATSPSSHQPVQTCPAIRCQISMVCSPFSWRACSEDVKSSARKCTTCAENLRSCRSNTRNIRLVIAMS